MSILGNIKNFFVGLFSGPKVTPSFGEWSTGANTYVVQTEYTTSYSTPVQEVYTKKELQKLKKSELCAILSKLETSFKKAAKKEELIKLVLKAQK